MNSKAQWKQLADEAITDAADWKATARKAQAQRDALLKALLTLVKSADVCGDMEAPLFVASLEEARAAIAQAEGK